MKLSPIPIPACFWALQKYFCMAHHNFHRTGIPENCFYTGVGQGYAIITLHNNLGNWCIFPENLLIYQGKLVEAANSLRRRNNVIFPRSEAKGK